MSAIKFSTDLGKVEEELCELMRTHTIDISAWGQGEYLGIKNLVQEVQAGESVMVEEGGKLFREVKVVHVRISIQHQGRKLYLKEDHIILADGRRRQRKIFGAVNEKLKPGEDPRQAARRGMKEELGVDYDFSQVDYTSTTTDKISASYVGLPCRFHNHLFIIELPEKDFRPDGYVEKAPDKTTFFAWTEIEPTYEY